MNAVEAKKLALTHKKRIDDNFTIKKRDAHTAEVDLLVNHFRNKIDEFVNKGSLVTDEISFPVDRFSDDVIAEVTHELRKDGYSLNMSKQSAYKKVGFTISWSA